MLRETIGRFGAGRQRLGRIASDSGCCRLLIIRTDLASRQRQREGQNKRNGMETRWFHDLHVASFARGVKPADKLASFQNFYIQAVMIKARKGLPQAGSPQDARVIVLITAAEEIFLAKGYHSATMDDVAQAAGMSKKTVYQLIHSKAELFVALLDHYQTRLIFPTAGPDWSNERILVEYLLVLATFLLSTEQVAIIRLIMAEYTHSPDLGRFFHQSRYKKAKTRLESCLADIAARQNARFKDLSEMSALLFGMTIGEFHLTVLVGFRAPPTKSALERRIRQGVAMFLAGSACALEPVDGL
jgi:AcrR family transcriptional regulator